MLRSLHPDQARVTVNEGQDSDELYKCFFQTEYDLPEKDKQLIVVFIFLSLWTSMLHLQFFHSCANFFISEMDLRFVSLIICSSGLILCLPFQFVLSTIPSRYNNNISGCPIL